MFELIMVVKLERNMKYYIANRTKKVSLLIGRKANIKGWCPVCEDEGDIQSCCNRCYQCCDC